MNKIIFLLFLLTLPFAGSAQALYGSWSGIAGKTCRTAVCDTILVSVELRGMTGTTEYTTSGCKGTLVFQNKTGNINYYREHITANKNNCPDGAAVSVMLNGEELIWTWNDSGNCWSGVLKGQKMLLPCKECILLRDRCHAACKDLNNAIDKAGCISECNKEYSCITGEDCK